MRDAVLPWEDTPYRSGQQLRGSAVDCVRFGAAVMDELCRKKRTLPKNLPLDTALHAPATARAALRRLLRLYPELEEITPNEFGEWQVQPGDVVITGPLYGGPGHLILVGWEPNTCWEASAPSVRKIGIGLDPRSCHIFHVYRYSTRSEWL